FSSRRRHTSWPRDWSSDVCSSDLPVAARSPCRPHAPGQLAASYSLSLPRVDSAATGLKQGMRKNSTHPERDDPALDEALRERVQIGRASCRERVQITAGAARSNKP